MRTWSRENERFLIDNRSRLTIPELARILGKSEKSVQCKCFKMGLIGSDSVRRNAIRASKIGENNPNWKGDRCGVRSGRDRARSLFKSNEPCSICGSIKSERHHKDGDTLNNEPGNVVFLCRKHHMAADGRLSELIKRNMEGANA